MHHTTTSTPSARSVLLLAAASAGLLASPATAASVYDDTTNDLSSTTASTPLSISLFDGITGRLASGDLRDDLTILGLTAGSLFTVTTDWSAVATDGNLVLQFWDSGGVALPGVSTYAPPGETGSDTRSFPVPSDGQVRLVATMTSFEFGSLTYSLNYASAAVPEPSTGISAAAALAALIARRRRVSQP